MTNTLTQLTETAWAVKLPEGSKNIQIHGLNQKNQLLYYRPDDWAENIKLPPGQWTALGFSDSLAEHEAAKVVLKYKSGKYAPYNNKMEWCDSALESMQSLLQSKGCINGKYYIIIKG